MKAFTKFYLAILCATVSFASAQPTAFDEKRIDKQADRRIVCVDGVLKWQDDMSEVALFGVNYYVPFSGDYLRLKSLRYDHKKAILEDLAHFQRIGITSIRLHTFERQFSDRDGNFIDNVHVDLLDFLIAECGKRNIYVILTPIAWWGGVQASPNAFASRYSDIREMVSQREAWKYQANFLTQFGKHKNKYNGRTYAEDPIIPAFELINEPIFPKNTSDEFVTEYINTLADALRASGTTKPIFFNAWQNRQVACSKARIDGITFPWYPSGLVAGHELTNDFLPKVHDYPSFRHPAVEKMAKMVYEFDCADILNPTMYPAMARTFRSVGVQIANQFQYDVLQLADSNASWQTHYLNLAYTPGKAISFAIATKIFSRIPRLEQFPPETNRTFRGVSLSHEKKLAEYVTETEFLYANNTDTRPENPEKLTTLWGVGSSPFVKSTGTGAYFLDKLADGDWLLEIYPSITTIRDPFVGGSAEKVRLLPVPPTLTFNFPPLNRPATIKRLDQKAPAQRFSNNTPLTLAPGQYRITADGVTQTAPLPNRTFLLPRMSDANTPILTLDTPTQFRLDEPEFIVTANGYLPKTTTKLEAVVRNLDGKVLCRTPLKKINDVTYQATLPTATFAGNKLCITSAEVAIDGKTLIFPEQHNALLANNADETWNIMTASPDLKLNPRRQNKPEATIQYNLKPQAIHHTSPGYDPANNCSGFSVDTKPLPKNATPNALRLVIAGDDSTSAVEIGLRQSDGKAYGAIVQLGSDLREIVIPLEHLNPLWSTKGGSVNPQLVTQLVFTTGTWLYPSVADNPHSLTVKSCDFVTKITDNVTLILEKDAPPYAVLFDLTNMPHANQKRQGNMVFGRDNGMNACSIEVSNFLGKKNYLTIILPISDDYHRLKKNAKTVAVTIKALYPHTDKIEIAFSETDGAAWGMMELPITTEWQTIEIPLEKLVYFSHWNLTCKGRGGPNDRLKPENLARISLCFGKFNLPDAYTKRNGFVIQHVQFK